MSSQNSAVTASAPMDPFSQAFTLYSASGAALNVTIPDLDDFIFYNVVICINYAAQLGASLVLLLIVLLMTSKEKRGSPIFMLNSLSLTINTIRNILLCLYFTGPFSETYAFFANDFSRVPRSAYGTSIAAAVLTLLLQICVEISLIFQVRVVCVTLRKLYRRGIFIVSSLIALLAIGFRLALCVENSMLILSLNNMLPIDWLNSAATITTSISICWFCVVFIIKLAFALNERRKLRLRQFGPMHILFIMGCQTLIIPGMSPSTAIQVALSNLSFSNILDPTIHRRHPFHILQRLNACLPLPSTLRSMGFCFDQEPRFRATKLKRTSQASRKLQFRIVGTFHDP